MNRSLGKIVAATVVMILIGTFTTAKASATAQKSRDGRFIAYDNGT
jgi:hypothetical protein